jgi:hypothetical protein
MVKNYFVLLLFVIFLFPLGLASQEIRIFKVEDFDLKGKVKSCLVSTKYGKEEYDFNEDGLLTKAVTRYNDNDYDITYYKYSTGTLLEKRFENYRDNTFDPASSIANIYSIDSTGNPKITEKIISYEKEFLDQYEYYIMNDTVRKIVRTNNEGVDETLIDYKTFKGEITKTYELNGVVKESVRTSVKKDNDSIVSKTVLSKRYLDGEPSSALEEVFDGRNNIMSETNFRFDSQIKTFAKEKSVMYLYDESGNLSTSQSVKGKSVQKKREYVYQFDPFGNWIKEIIIPDNAYKTRKITYYEEVLGEEKPE